MKVHPDMVQKWQRTLSNYDRTRYRQNGIRAIDEQQPALSCRITHLGFSYISEGLFIPNNLSPDSNANRRLDIFRCPLGEKHSAEASRRFVEENELVDDVNVEILRGNATIISFNVSWLSRGSGYMLSPAGTGQVSSTLDMWAGLRLSYYHGRWRHRTIYLCVSGSSVLPSKESLPYYLEFVQHHVNMGVAHIFLGVAFAWDSPHMRILLRVLRSFIRDGLLTIQSHSGDSLDLTFSLAGMTFERSVLSTCCHSYRLVLTELLIGII